MDRIRDIAVRICGRLREAGHVALFAGGCVRDALRGVTPTDWDIATSALPEEITALFRRTVAVGAQFGVILVVEEGRSFEVTTFRAESGYSDGRHPDSVRYTGDPSEDARRRDFTVNGLFLDPFSGEIFDWVGGRADLEKGILRTIGDPSARFAEDSLRLMRAPRFVAVLGFTLDPAAAAAARPMAERLSTVSAERVRDELLKLLTAPRRRAGVECMADLGLLDVVLPEVAALRGVEQPSEFHPEGDVLEHTLLMLDRAEHPSATLALGILLHDAGKPTTARVADRIRFDRHAHRGAEIAARVCRRLKLPNAHRARVVALVGEHMKFIEVRRMRTSTLKRFLRQDGFDEHLELHRLDCLSSHGSLENWEFARAKIAEFGAEGLKPPRLIDGRDLSRMGIPPGPTYGRILKAVEEEQLNGRLSDRAGALALARRLLEEDPGPRPRSPRGPASASLLFWVALLAAPLLPGCPTLGEALARTHPSFARMAGASEGEAAARPIADRYAWAWSGFEIEAGDMLRGVRWRSRLKVRNAAHRAAFYLEKMLEMLAREEDRRFACDALERIVVLGEGLAAGRWYRASPDAVAEILEDASRRLAPAEVVLGPDPPSRLPEAPAAPPGGPWIVKGKKETLRDGRPVFVLELAGPGGEVREEEVEEEGFRRAKVGTPLPAELEDGGASEEGS